MYLLYLHTVHNIMYLQSFAASYMYFFAACVVPVFIAYSTCPSYPPLAPSKGKKPPPGAVLLHMYSALLR